MPPVKLDWSKVDKLEPKFERFGSRRSVVYGTKGIVSASQPLAVAAGLEILQKGGNAGEGLVVTSVASISRSDAHRATADAAVATSAALNVTEPSCCGIGG